MLYPTHLPRSLGDLLDLDVGKAPRSYPSFARILGATAWARLPAAVRARFDGRSGRDGEKLYLGVMNRVEASRAGLWLARLCRLIGTPIAPHTGDRVPTIVRLFDVPARAGVAWERLYRFPGRPIVSVLSTKMLDENGALIEALGFGLRMTLRLEVIGRELHFISCGYYFEWGWIRFALPNWFPPGVVTIIHRDLGSGRFVFILKTEHPWFGQMFYQEGEFTDGGLL